MTDKLKGYSWDMGGYVLHTPQSEHGKLTLKDAEQAYQLVPRYSPKRRLKDQSTYILRAQKYHAIKHVFFFMSENEAYFNNAIEQFTSSNGDSLTPERYMDMKMACREAILYRFTEYSAAHGATFLTYLRRVIHDTLLKYRMSEENWTISSLTEYKRARLIMAIYDKCKGNEPAALRIYCHRYNCNIQNARKLLDAARQMRHRRLPVALNEDGDEWEQDDELIADHWDYASILCSGMDAAKFDQAFRKLTYREQTMLEERNAVCMNCGRVSLLNTRASFEDLAAMFEGSTASGAERAYNRAVEHLLFELVKAGQLHCVEIRQKSVHREDKTITAAVYEYLVDNDGEWGEIQFDLVEKTARVEEFAEKDLCDTWEITDYAINAVLEYDGENPPKKALIPIILETYLYDS